MAKQLEPTEEIIGMETVESVELFKKGTISKGKRKGQTWRLWQIETEEGTDAKGFDKVKEGDEVEIFETTTYDEDGDPEYTNTNFRVVKGGAKKAKKAAPADDDDDDDDEEEAPEKSAKAVSTGSDKRIMKLLVVIAEQIGVDKEEIDQILEEK